MTTTVAWVEFPVRDFDVSIPFYKTVCGFDIEIMDMSYTKSAIFMAPKGVVSADLTIGTPAPKGTGPIIHLGVGGALEDAAKRCAAAVGDIVTIPPGRFQIAYDPDGNTVGLFEPAQGPKSCAVPTVFFKLFNLCEAVG